MELEEIWLYTFERWSKEKADIYYKSIIAEIENVAWDFERGNRLHKFAPVIDHQKLIPMWCFIEKLTVALLRLLEYCIKKWIGNDT